MNPSLRAESLSYSGRLVTHNGSPVTGNVNLKFELAYTNDLNVILCSQQLSNVSLSHGVFHAKLTPVCPSSTLLKVLEEIPPFNSIAIRVTDETANKQYPFQALHSVPLTVLSQTSKQLVQMGATSGQILSWDGGKWVPVDPSASSGGTITSISVGDGLYGGTITTSGTIGIADGGVTSNKLDSMGALTSGQVLKWNGSSWTAGADEDNGVNESNLRKFALKNDPLTPAPTCSGHQVLRYILLTDSLECFDLVNDNIDETKSDLAPSQKVVAEALALKQDKIESSLKLTHADSSWVTLQAPAGGGNISYTLPLMGTSGQVLKLGAAGVLTWGDTGVSGSDIAANSITNTHVADGALSKSKISGLTTDLGAIDTRITNLKTDDVAEGSSNKYFTNDRVLLAPLTGLTPTTGSVAAMDSLLVALNKIVGNATALSGTVTTLASNQNHYLEKGGGSMSGNLVMSGNLITGLGAPLSDSDAATKKYVDDKASVATTWLKNDPDIYYDAGNVGVGTSAPSSIFHITPPDDSWSSSIRIDRSWDSVTDFVQIMYDYQGLKIRTMDDGDDEAHIIFKPKDSEALRITESGFVGIGTTLPVEKLDISGNLALSGKIRLKSDNANYVELMAPAALSAPLTFNLPNSYGTSGEALVTNGTGILSWANVATTATAVGGDLNGTIANAQLNANAVGTSEIANSSVTYEKLNLLDGDIPEAKVSGLTTQLGNKEPTINGGTNDQYWRGDKSWQTLNTSVVPEGSRLYFLDSRVRDALMSTYTTGSALPLANTDKLIEALGKLEGQIIANKAAFEATGHWSKNLTDLYYNGGNVGIGTTNPTTQLDIVGNGTVGVNVKRISNLNPPFLSLTRSQGTIASETKVVENDILGQLRFRGVTRNLGDTADSELILSSIASSVEAVDAAQRASSKLSFFTASSSASATEKMTITSSGNVGVGTSSPAAKIHAEIPDIGAGVRVSDASAPAGFMTLGDAGSAVSSFSPLINARPAGGANRYTGFYSDIASGDDTGTVPVMVLAGRHNSGDLMNRPVLQVKNNTNPLMTILPSGNVGIGVTSPISPLDVGLLSVLFPDTVTSTFSRGADPNYRLQTKTGVATNATGDLVGFFGMNYDTTENAGINFYRGSNLANGYMALRTNATDRMLIQSNGQIGVGTSTPTGLVHINTTHGGTIGGASSQMNTAGLVISNADNQYLAMDGNEIRQFGTGDLVISGETGFTVKVGDLTDATELQAIRVLSNGNVGIGTNGPTYKLHVIGTAGLSTGTAWTNASDLRLKDIHGDYEYGLDEVLKLHTVRYNYKKDNSLALPSDFSKIGFIAQEVQKVIPDAVTEREDGYLELNVDPIHWAVVNSIKDLYRQHIVPLFENDEKQDIAISSLVAENEKLRKENIEIKARLERIEKALEAGQLQGP